MRRVNPLIALLGLFVLFTSCVKEYPLGDIYEHEGLVSVSGALSDQEGLQEIKLFYSAPLQNQIPKPIEYCLVWVEDQEGKRFEYRETRAGYYVRSFQEGEVEVGRSYRMCFVTWEGKQYESTWEVLQPAPETTDPYYEFESVEVRELGVKIPGLQFYTDFNAGEVQSDFYRIELYATYKFHTAYQDIYWMKDGEFGPLPMDSVRHVCYITEKVPDIFLISGEYLSTKEILGYPLHFESNQTAKLLRGYSLELRLATLSKPEYVYWKNMRLILKESGGLFERQPPIVEGNFCCSDDPEEVVLGYFGASAVSSRRIFIPSKILDDYDIPPYCEPAPLPPNYLLRMERMGMGIAFFVYMVDHNGNYALHVVQKKCFDCTVFPYSTTQKPDFWEE